MACRRAHLFQCSNTGPSFDSNTLTPFPFRRDRLDLSATELAALPAADAVADLAECATPCARSCPWFLNAAVGRDESQLRPHLTSDVIRFIRRNAWVSPGNSQAMSVQSGRTKPVRAWGAEDCADSLCVYA